MKEKLYSSVRTWGALPRKYCILPASIDFIIPEFRSFYSPGDKTLALKHLDCETWFNEFVDKIVRSVGREFLPVCRMSDGEFRFALGDQPASLRLPLRSRIKHRVHQWTSSLLNRGDFFAATAPSISSGFFSKTEWSAARLQYGKAIRKIAEKGILAIHLSYGQFPFQEHYFPALRKWLNDNQIDLNDENYFPFYFVYAFLVGHRRAEILNGRRVLVVNCAIGAKQDKIKETLLREGASAVLWLSISTDRSFYDRLDLSPFVGKIDVALVAAGIGKPNVLGQMEILKVPCIDAGYVLEVWANPEARWNRVYCVTDEEFDANRIRCIPSKHFLMQQYQTKKP